MSRFHGVIALTDPILMWAPYKCSLTLSESNTLSELESGTVNTPSRLYVHVKYSSWSLGVCGHPDGIGIHNSTAGISRPGTSLYL